MKNPEKTNPHDFKRDAVRAAGNFIAHVLATKVAQWVDEWLKKKAQNS